jgi:hypothetical protein
MKIFSVLFSVFSLGYLMVTPFISLAYQKALPKTEGYDAAIFILMWLSSFVLIGLSIFLNIKSFYKNDN